MLGWGLCSHWLCLGMLLAALGVTWRDPPLGTFGKKPVRPLEQLVRRRLLVAWMQGENASWRHLRGWLGKRRQNSCAGSCVAGFEFHEWKPTPITRAHTPSRHTLDVHAASNSERNTTPASRTACHHAALSDVDIRKPDRFAAWRDDAPHARTLTGREHGP